MSISSCDRLSHLVDRAYCNLRNETKRNETKRNENLYFAKSVICEMKICILRNEPPAVRGNIIVDTRT